MKSLYLVPFLFLCSPVFSQELPSPTSASKPSVDMVWNKWESEDFIVLSIDFNFGRQLKSSLQRIKSDFFESWGLKETPLPVKCKVVCVPDSDTLKKFFSLESPRCEVRSEGQTKEISIWLEHDRLRELPGLVASACLHDQPIFLRRGVPILMCSDASRMSKLILSSSGSAISMKSVSEDQTKKISPSDLAHLDAQSVVVCLFIRREFGRDAFASVLAGRSIKEACGFAKEDSLDAALSRYCENLKSDLKYGKTPDWYLIR